MTVRLTVLSNEIELYARPTMDTTLMKVVDAMGLRSTCSRHAVGAVIARDGRIISTGYNGAPSGMPHCDHRGTGPLEGCYVAVHAEVNAIAFAARNGVATDQSTLYCSLTPCLACAKLIINAGVTRVVAKEDYRDGTGVGLLNEAGVDVELMWERT